MFTGGINLTARIDSAAIGGVVITVTKTSGTFGGNGVLRLCRGEGNYCETVVDTPYTAGAASVTFPAFTPRLRRQDFYYVQRYDAVTIGGLDPNVRSAQMIVIADNAEAGRLNAVQVTASVDSSCALTTNGSVRCWSQSALSPVSVSGLPANVSKIAGTTRHVCAMASGQVYCWGSNFSGELGDGTTTARATAAQVTGISGVVTDVFAGSSTTCALVGASSWCWGSNQYGQATGGGSPNAPANSLTPAAVPSLGSAVVLGTLGAGYGCVVRADATVSCWGVNNSGQLGNATGIGSNLVYPASTISGLSAAQLSTGTSSSVCAARFDTSIWCWGANSNGELGRGTTTPNEFLPARASALSSNALRVSVGAAAACAVALGDALQCWGDNSYGQLGSGKRIDNISTIRPVERTLIPEGVLNTAGAVRSVAIGFQSMCIAMADGSVRCSGHTSLGDGSTNDSSTPVTVIGFGAAQSTYAAPTVQTFVRTGDAISLVFQDTITPAAAPITQSRWACRRVGQSAFTALGGQVDLNEAGGRQHTVQGYLVGPGPWECQVMFRNGAGYSAWSAWTTVTSRPSTVPTMVSAVYDGSFGTLVFSDNIPASDGPIVGISATCTVGSGAPQSTVTTGCDVTNTFCSVSQVVSEPSASRHTIRLPLPAGISSVSCRARETLNKGTFLQKTSVRFFLKWQRCLSFT